MRKNPNYFWRVLIGLDQAANAILGGDPEETISARMAGWKKRPDRGLRKRAGSLTCGILAAIDPGHCERSEKVREVRQNDKAITQYPYRGIKTDEPRAIPSKD